MLSPALLVSLALAATPKPTPESRYEPLVDAALKETEAVYRVPKALVFAVMRQESAFNPKAVSKCGALGLMQLMPYNARKVGVQPELLFEPEHNIRAGVRLLAALLRYYRGDIISALIAYNSRPRKLYSKVPQNGETPDYCVRVLKFYTGYLKRFPPPVPAAAAGTGR